MVTFKKAGIVGTGLIGGSLGLALKKGKIARGVVGTSRHDSSLRVARNIGAIDKGSRDLDILAGCDLVILATPVETIIKQAEKIKQLIPQDCIVIDVASTKEMVVKAAHHAFSRFVGCHPLAGSEKRGIAHARQDLFKGAHCIITPVRGTDAAALAKVRTLWKSLGARLRIIDPAAHDRILAYISHLPHILAFALIDTVPEAYLADSPQSLRDMTRIAASSPELWDDICMTNRRNLAASIGSFIVHMKTIRAALLRRDKRSLHRVIARAQKKRQRSL